MSYQEDKDREELSKLLPGDIEAGDEGVFDPPANQRSTLAKPFQPGWKRFIAYFCVVFVAWNALSWSLHSLFGPEKDISQVGGNSQLEWPLFALPQTEDETHHHGHGHGHHKRPRILNGKLAEHIFLYGSLSLYII